jgi:hypothetical protein
MDNWMDTIRIQWRGKRLQIRTESLSYRFNIFKLLILIKVLVYITTYKR